MTRHAGQSRRLLRPLVSGLLFVVFLFAYGCMESVSVSEMTPLDPDGNILWPDAASDGDDETEPEEDGDGLWPEDGDAVDMEQVDTEGAQLSLTGLSGNGGAIVIGYEILGVSASGTPPTTLAVSYLEGSSWRTGTLREKASIEDGLHTAVWLSHLDQPFRSITTRIELSLSGGGWDLHAISDPFGIENHFFTRSFRVDHPPGIPVEAGDPLFSSSTNGKRTAVLWHQDGGINRKNFVSLFDAERDVWSEAGTDFPLGFPLDDVEEGQPSLPPASEEFCLAVGEEEQPVVGVFRALHGEGIRRLYYLELEFIDNKPLSRMAQPILVNTTADLFAERNLACVRLDGRSVVLHTERWTSWNDIVATSIYPEGDTWKTEFVHIASGTLDAFRSMPRLRVLGNGSLLASWIEPSTGGISNIVTLSRDDGGEWTDRTPLLPVPSPVPLKDYHLFASPTTTPMLALALIPAETPTFTPRFLQGAIHRQLTEIDVGLAAHDATIPLSVTWGSDSDENRFVWVWSDPDQQRLLYAVNLYEGETWGLGSVENFQSSGLEAGGVTFANHELSNGLAYWRGQTREKARRVHFEWAWTRWNPEASVWEAPHTQSEPLVSQTERVSSFVSGFGGKLLYLAAIERSGQKDLFALSQNTSGVATQRNPRPGYAVDEASSELPVTRVMGGRFVSVFLAEQGNGNWPYISVQPAEDTEDDLLDIPFYKPGLQETLDAFQIGTISSDGLAAVLVVDTGSSHDVKTVSITEPPTEAPAWQTLISSPSPLDIPLFQLRNGLGLLGYWSLTEGERALYLLASSNGGRTWTALPHPLLLPADRLTGGFSIRWGQPLSIGYHLRDTEDEQSLRFVESSLSDDDTWNTQDVVSYRAGTTAMLSIELSDRHVWVHADADGTERTRITMEQSLAASDERTSLRGPLLEGNVLKLTGRALPSGKALELLLWLRDAEDTDRVLSLRYDTQTQSWDQAVVRWQADEDQRLTDLRVRDHPSGAVLLAVKHCGKDTAIGDEAGKERVFVLLRPASATTWSEAQPLLLQGEFHDKYDILLDPDGTLLAPYLKRNLNGLPSAYLRVWP